MPNKKKRSFNKGNTEKFLLLRGSSQAVNADGETLENVLVPVSKNYKPGTSLLMSNIAALAGLEPEDEEKVLKEPDGEGSLCNESDIFADASSEDDLDAEDTVENLLGDLKKLKCTRTSNETNLYEDFENCENYAVISPAEREKRNGPKQDDQYRLESWKMFNEKFEDVLEEYDDDDIGSLEGDNDIFDLRTVSPEPFARDIEDHQKELELVLGDYDDEIKEKILKYVDDSGDEKVVEIVTEKPLEFDCESILSTYSNKYNHPTVIKEEKPQRSRITSHIESDSDDESRSSVLQNSCNLRKKDETPEERRERQRKFKEAKRLRRELKKQNKEAFKEEKKSQTLKANQNAGIKLV